MSILIKGIRMPESCAECRFCVNGFTDNAPMYECACQSYDNVSVLVDKDGQPFDFRPEWCPLIEVQSPHGRLIDASARVTTGTQRGFGLRVVTVDTLIDEHAVRNVPTIIEAEGSE